MGKPLLVRALWLCDVCTSYITMCCLWKENLAWNVDRRPWLDWIWTRQIWWQAQSRRRLLYVPTLLQYVLNGECVRCARILRPAAWCNACVAALVSVQVCRLEKERTTAQANKILHACMDNLAWPGAKAFEQMQRGRVCTSSVRSKREG
jgi:hypothetical protein